MGNSYGKLPHRRFNLGNDLIIFPGSKKKSGNPRFLKALVFASKIYLGQEFLWLSQFKVPPPKVLSCSPFFSGHENFPKSPRSPLSQTIATCWSQSFNSLVSITLLGNESISLPSSLKFPRGSLVPVAWYPSIPESHGARSSSHHWLPCGNRCDERNASQVGGNFLNHQCIRAFCCGNMAE